MIRLLLLVTAALLLAGIGGGLHPAGDSLAVLRPVLGVFALTYALALLSQGRRRWAVLGVVMTMLGFLPYIGFRWQGGEGNILIYQKNMKFSNDALEALAEDIIASGAHVVTLQEVSSANRAALPVLAETYPIQHVCPFAGIGGVAVLSRWPQVPGTATCAGRNGVAAIQIESPDGPLWLVSIHLHWPWPHGQAAQVARIRGFLAGLEGPKLVGGDFNMVPWAWRMQDMERLLDARIIGPPRITYSHPDGWLHLPIDHVLVTGGQGMTALRPAVGSDHRGVLARLTPLP